MKCTSLLPAIALLCLANTPIVFSQQRNWDAGFRMSNELHAVQNAPHGPGERPLFADKGILAGLYATRYFGNRWSLRGEFNFQQITGPEQPYRHGSFDLKTYNSTSFVLASRYRVLRWLDLELALEARRTWNDPYNKMDGAVWAGAAIHLANAELNLRYSPSDRPNNILTSGGWTNSVQVGLSVPLIQRKK